MLITVLGGFFGVTKATEAQDLKLSEVTISLKFNQIPLKKALNEIEERTEFIFAFSYSSIDLERIVSADAQEQSVEHILKHLFKDRRVSWALSGNVILLKHWASQNQEGQSPGMEFSVEGRVVDAQSGETLPGVNILVKGTSIGTSTNAEGHFVLTAPSANDTLIFSFIGYQRLEVPINGRTELNVQMQSQAVAGDEVVVVGFGTQEKADLTSAISTVNVENMISSRPISDLGKGLQGVVPSLTISTPTGEIGSNPKITLRGLRGSVNSAGATPLILVDGVEVENINYINPSDVESISVLKDAASTAIYGTRAAWGAILITTKYGEKGAPPRVTYSGNYSIATPTTDLDLAPAAEGAEMAFSAMQRDNPSINRFCIVGMCIDEPGIQKMRDWEEQYGNQSLSNEMVMGRDFEIRDGGLFFYRPWDAGDMFMKEWTPMQKHNLSISGGGEHTSYSLGLGYLNQEGVMTVNTDEWKRYNVDLGVNSTINNWLDARGKFRFSQTDHVKPYPNSRGTYDGWYYLYRWPQTYPYGTYEGLPFRSAVTELEQANDSDNSASLSRISVGGTASLAEGLALDTDFSYTSNDVHTHQTGGIVSAYNFWAGGGNLNYGPYTTSSFNEVIYASSWVRRSNLRSLLTWQNEIADHSFKIMAGGESEIYRYWYQSSSQNGLLDPDKGEIGLATGDQFVGGDRSHWATLGFFGRINYSFKDRYLIQLNGRYDGSSRFPSHQRWGFFPSISVGYKISDEAFMKFIQPAISFLKVRGSYGSVGNNAVGTYPYISTMSSESSGWLINNSETEPTFTTPGAVSSSLTWEKVTTLDIGLDARLFDDKIDLTFDWYTRTTSNMLSAGITLPASFGTGAPRRNFGELQTRGWELQIGWNHSLTQESYISMTGVLSDFKEKITKFAGSTKQIPSSNTAYHHPRNQYYEGMVLGEIWGYETDRLFTKNDFRQDANGNLLTDEEGNYILKEGIPNQSIFEDGGFSYGPGDVKYKDLNGDGVINYGANTVGDSGDQKIIGNSTPRYQYGLRIEGGWKAFDASVFFQGVGKREFWANGPVFVPGYRPNEGWYKHQLDYWTPDNPDAFYPRPTNHRQQAPDAQRNFLPQTRYLLDMSYLRVKNITIGYTLPADISNSILIQNLRIYVSAENLFELDNMDLPIDPETDYTSAGLNDPNSFGRVYPFRRTISAGISMTF